MRSLLVLCLCLCALVALTAAANTRLKNNASVPLRVRQGDDQDSLCSVFGGQACVDGQAQGQGGEGQEEPLPGYEVVTTEKSKLDGGAIVSKDKNCTCVPYYQCDENEVIKVDGTGIIDIRMKEECHYLEFCCKLPHSAPNPYPQEPHKPEPPLPLYPDPSQPQQPIYTTPPPHYPEHEYPHPTPPPSHSHKCGVRNPEGIGFRITGDEDGEAQFGEFPWMVAILQEERVDEQSRPLNLYQCGGALITPNVVLTGAHCVKNKPASSLKIRAGEWDTQTMKEMYEHQDRSVIDVVVHPNFHPGNLHNDMALLILHDPVQIGGHIGLICLPEQDQHFDYNRCFASGWGKDKFGHDGEYQVILKKRELPIVSNPQCQELLRKTRLGAYFLLDASFICAGGENGKDTCKGDGGGPLVCPLPHDPSRYVQAGIVAWGIDCGKPMVPGVYGNVARFRHWIDNELQRLQIDTSPYHP